jgi:hypothetical protein
MGLRKVLCTHAVLPVVVQQGFKKCKACLIYRHADRQADWQTDRHADRQADWQADRHADRQADWHTYRQTGRQTDKQTGMKSGRQTVDWQADRQAGGRLTAMQTGRRQTDRQTGRQTDRLTGRQTDSHADRQAEDWQACHLAPLSGSRAQIKSCNRSNRGQLGKGVRVGRGGVPPSWPREKGFRLLCYRKKWRQNFYFRS